MTTGGKYLTTGGKRLYTGDPNHPWQLLSEDGEPGKQGLPGEKGKDGVQYYTWLKYADDAQGNGMSELPDGKKYVGLAVNQLTPIESDDPSLYTWALIVGEGIPVNLVKTERLYILGYDTPMMLKEMACLIILMARNT